MATAWNSTRNVAAHTASGVPTPAQATMRPRLAMVEYANTRFALACEMAMKLHSRKVKPPTRMVMTAATGQTRKIGESLMSKKTPALTMVDECRSAEVGVGATIAPSSQVWNGI